MLTNNSHNQISCIYAQCNTIHSTVKLQYADNKHSKGSTVL